MVGVEAVCSRKVAIDGRDVKISHCLRVNLAPVSGNSALSKKFPQSVIAVSLLMVTAVALLQLAFLSLGTVMLKGIIHASGDVPSSVYLKFVNDYWLWFFLIPVVWYVYGQISYLINKGPFKQSVIGVVGGFVSGICFVYFASVLFVH